MVLERLQLPSLPILICVAAVLALIEWIVICANRRYRVGQPFDERSPYPILNPTCGGAIWALAAIVAAIVFGDRHLWTTWTFAGSIAVLAVISAVDDLHPLPPIPRLLVQIVLFSLSFASLIRPDTIDVFLIILILGVGLINAINFLDGICGMLGLYGLVVSATLLYELNIADIPGTAWLAEVMVYVIVAQVVFTLFNLRDTIFAGDAGAITLGYIHAFVVMTLIIATGDFTVLVFFAVCIFDTGLTTLWRLLTPGVSILAPHRTHTYHILTGVRRKPHLAVSAGYALIQLIISILYLVIPTAYHLLYLICVAVLLTTVYVALRRCPTDIRVND